MSFPEWMGFRLVSLVFRESKFFLHLLRSPDVLSLVFSWNYGAKKVFDICFCTRDVRKVCFHLHLLAPCYFPSDSRIASEIYAFSLPPFRSISSSSLKILLRHPVIVIIAPKNWSLAILNFLWGLGWRRKQSDPWGRSTFLLPREKIKKTKPNTTGTDLLSCACLLASRVAESTYFLQAVFRNPLGSCLVSSYVCALFPLLDLRSLIIIRSKWILSLCIRTESDYLGATEEAHIETLLFFLNSLRMLGLMQLDIFTAELKFTSEGIPPTFSRYFRSFCFSSLNTETKWKSIEPQNIRNSSSDFS